MRDAQLQFQHGCILTCLFIIFYSVIPLTNHIDTFIGFVSHYFFLIVALATILYASIKYILIKNQFSNNVELKSVSKSIIQNFGLRLILFYCLK